MAENARMTSQKGLLRAAWVVAGLFILIGLNRSNLPFFRETVGTNGKGYEVGATLSYYLIAGILLVLALLLITRMSLIRKP
jgi:hypothetical protein